MIEKILEYQKLEAELQKVNSEVQGSVDRKKAVELQEIRNKEYAKYVAFEKSSEKVLNAYNKAAEKYELYMKKLNELEKELENADESKVALYEKAYKDFFAVANALEKEIAVLYKQSAEIVEQSDEVKKNTKDIVNKLKVHKEAFAKLKAQKEPIINDITAKMESMKNGLDQKLFQKYLQKREGKKFPVFVSLINKQCGGCRMEISAAKLTSMKNSDYGIIECENCGRYIYQK